MELSSNSFADGGAIPGEYALGLPDPDTHVTFGPNRNPHLAWSDPPEGTRSLALICHDRDVPTRPDDVNQEGREVPSDLPRADFFHWVVVDLPAELREIGEGTFADGVVPHGQQVASGPHGCRQGLNDYTGWFAGDPDMEGKYFGYDGPCPPWNDSLIHHYEFTLYALSVPSCAVSGDFTGAGVREAIADDILDQAQIMGTYTLNPRLGS
ncbi:MAG: YbhB/YbcL family Raf kinase inhibitor-like protein [Acidimicrobiia bacterium]|nr:YbhB/YbcL family Raf kinase inhibitor-like protein [Acidimicrobiia bacterium]